MTDRSLEEAWRAFAHDPDEAAFAPIYEATRGIAMAVCRRVLRDEEDALDAFQATYARLLLEARDRPKELASATGAGPVPRLAGLEANALRKRRARASRRFGFRVADAPSSSRRADPMRDAGREFVQPGPGPAEVAAERERREKLEAIVSSLGERDRVVIQLRYFDGLSLEDVARAVGMPLASVSSRIRRALRRLEGPVREAGLGDAATVLGATLVAGAGVAVGAKIASGSIATAATGISGASTAATVATASAATAPSASAVFAKAATALASGSLEASAGAGASAQPGFASALLALLAGLFKSHPVVSTAVALTTLAAAPAVMLVTASDDPGIVVAPPRPARTPEPYVAGPPLPSMDDVVRASAARFAGVVGYEYEWESEERIDAGAFNDSGPPHLRRPGPIPETLYSPPTDLVLRGAGRVLATETRLLEIEERERYLPGALPGALPGGAGVRFSRDLRRLDAAGSAIVSWNADAPESREYSDGSIESRSSARNSEPYSILPLGYFMPSAWGFMEPHGARFATNLAERWRLGGWRLDDGDLVLEVASREPFLDSIQVWLDPEAAFRTRSIRSGTVWDFAYDPGAEFSALPASIERRGPHDIPLTVRLGSRRLFREGLDEPPGDDAFRFPPPGPGARIADHRGLVRNEYLWWEGVRYHVGDAGRFVPWPRDEPLRGPTGTFAEHPSFEAVFDLTAGEVARFAHPAAHPLPEAPGPEPTPAWIRPRYETEYTPIAFPAIAPLRVSLVSVQRREEYEMEDEWATFELRYPTAGVYTPSGAIDDEERVRAHLRRGDWGTWGEFSIQALSMASGAIPSARVKLAFRPAPLMQKPRPEPAMTTEPILQLVVGRASPDDREALHRYHRAAVPLLRRHGLRLLGTHAAPEGSHPWEPLVYLLASDSYETARHGWIALLDDPDFVALRERTNPRVRMLLASGNEPFFMPAGVRPILESPDVAGRVVFEIRRYFQGERTATLSSLLDATWEGAFESSGARVLRVVRPRDDRFGTVEVLLLYPDAAHARSAAERLEKDPRYAAPLEAARVDGSLVHSDVRTLE